MVLVIFSSEPSIFMTCFNPNSSIFLDKNITFSKLASDSAEQAENAA